MPKTLVAFLFAAIPLAAIDTSRFHDHQDRTLACGDWSSQSDMEHACEVREQTLPATGAIHVDAGQNGGVSVKGWSGSNILLRSRVEAWAPTAGEAKSMLSAVTSSTAGGTIQPSGPRTSGRGGWSVSYEIFVPHLTSLDLHASNGGIHIADVGGTLQFETVNGGIHLTRVAGEVKGTTTNGGVHVDLAGTRWDGQGLDVSSTNGGVHLNIPTGYSGQLETSTVNGGFSSDLSELASERQTKSHSISATLGAGGALLRVTTVNGGVTVSKSGSEM